MLSCRWFYIYLLLSFGLSIISNSSCLLEGNYIIGWVFSSDCICHSLEKWMRLKMKVLLCMLLFSISEDLMLGVELFCWALKFCVDLWLKEEEILLWTIRMIVMLLFVEMFFVYWSCLMEKKSSGEGNNIFPALVYYRGFYELFILDCLSLCEKLSHKRFSEFRNIAEQHISI